MKPVRNVLEFRTSSNQNVFVTRDEETYFVDAQFVLMSELEFRGFIRELGYWFKEQTGNGG